MIARVRAGGQSIKALIFTSMFMMFAPDVHAMSKASAADLASAQATSANELKAIRDDFHVEIRDRFAKADKAILDNANLDSTAFVSAEIETLPSAEIAAPWVLHSSDASADVLDREDVSTFETAQLVPGDGAGDGGLALRSQ